MSEPFDLETVDRLLSTTRAVRRRLDLERPVERTLLLDCIRLSQQAPTGSNTQGWRWMIVTDEDKRRALAELYRRAGADYLKAGQKQAEQSGKTTNVPRLDGSAVARAGTRRPCQGFSGHCRARAAPGTSIAPGLTQMRGSAPLRGGRVKVPVAPGNRDGSRAGSVNVHA